MFKKTSIINDHLFQFRVGLASNLVLDVVNVGTSGARKSKTICSFLNAKDVRTGRTEHQHLSIIFSVKKSSFVSLPFHVSNYNQIKNFHQKKFSYIIIFRMGTCLHNFINLRWEENIGKPNVLH
jgi:hypothetical protein